MAGWATNCEGLVAGGMATQSQLMDSLRFAEPWGCISLTAVVYLPLLVLLEMIPKNITGNIFYKSTILVISNKIVNYITRNNRVRVKCSKSLGSPAVKGESEFQVSECVSVGRIESLLECIKDTTKDSPTMPVLTSDTS